MHRTKAKHWSRASVVGLTLVLSLAGLAQAQSGTWWNDDWDYRKSITIDHTQVDADLIDFPVLISMTDIDLTKARADGWDLVFTNDTHDVQYDHEIESFDQTTGTLHAWVRVPLLSSSSPDTELYLYYGNAGVLSSEQDPTAVWDTFYKMIHHFEEVSAPHLDSTVNANDGTVSGGVTQGAGLGKIDGGVDFTNGKITVAHDPDGGGPLLPSLDITDVITYEAWIKPDALPGGAYWNLLIKGANPNFTYQFYVSGNGDGYLNFFSNNSPGVSSDTALTVGAWQHAAVTVDGFAGQIKFYIDGVQVAAKSANFGSSSSADMQIGSFNTTNYFDGSMDEIRISQTVRSAEWISAAYNNQNDPSSFYTVGSEETGGMCGNSTVDPGEDCDDGNTVGGDCCSATCQFEPLGSPCDDGLFCNGTETCSSGVCGGSSGDPCPGPDGDDDCQESCDEAADNCLADDPDGSACDDGLFCSGTETCSAGVCGGSTGDPCPGPDGDNNCQESCDEAADNCLANDPDGSQCFDALFCNGTETCSSGVCGSSSGNPCPGPDGDDDCQESCDEAADDCLANDPDGSACDDALFCNGTETCSAGACGGSTGDPCPGPDGDDDCQESCDETADNCLANDPEDSACNDGLFCNGAETCSAGFCGGSTGDPCPGPDGDDDCQESCDEVADDCLGNDPESSACDDGLFCTVGEACFEGGCGGGINPCTDPLPACDEENDACVECIVDEDCPDMVFCDGAEICVDNICVTDADPCDDGVPCTNDVCIENPPSCTNTPNDLLCDDGAFCNGFETCDPEFGCLPGVEPCVEPTPICDEINDVCLEQCVTNADCDDGNVCTWELCNAGDCLYSIRPYGDIDRNFTLNLFDVFCVLELIGGTTPSDPDCVKRNADIVPCEGDDVLSLFDIFGVLNAIGGADPCCSDFGLGVCCTDTDPCFGINSDPSSECTDVGGIYYGLDTNCGDSDGDGILDIHETNSGVVQLPCETGTDPTNPDTDGDGISDGEEVYGSADVDLPAMGANPLRMDIFVEIDWTMLGAVSHEPIPSAIAAVQTAFANAPVVNPDGTTGITLHVDYGQGGLFTGGEQIAGEWEFITFDGGFNSFKSTFFAQNRRGLFHYAIFTHRHDDENNPASGVAELVGDDLMVTLHDAVSEQNMAGTFMRMLGYNLGLRAGGDEDRDFKPNYNSVMNSRYQLDGRDVNCDAIGDGALGFSDGTLAPLNENNLDEFAGVCGDVAINWDGNGLSSSVSANVNCVAGSTASCGDDGGVCYDQTCDVLLDFDDWANIELDALGTHDPGTMVGYGVDVPASP